MIVGEIGFPRKEFLYEISFWEARRIIKGYQNRHRDAWSMTRWQTYNLMAAFCGSRALNEAGIFKPTDLMKFPWEDDKVNEPPITKEEEEEMVAYLNDINSGKIPFEW